MLTHAGAPWAARSYGYPQYLADMAAWLQQQSLPRVHWVGTSMGGLIGMCIAATPPEAGRTVEFVSLTINDVGPFVPAAALDRLADYVGKAAVFDDLAQAEAAFRARFKPFHPVVRCCCARSFKPCAGRH